MSINTVLSSTYVRWILIPVVLLSFWLGLSILYSSHNNFTILQYPHFENKYNHFINKQLLKNQKLTGIFRASENNLGIISVKFGKMQKVEYEKEDTFTFRIKEEGQDMWIYETIYRSGLASTNDYLPFGFETIKQSKGKTYIFELISLNGNFENALKTGRTNPVYLSKYKFSKSEILRNATSMSDFFVKKIITLVINTDLLLSTSIFLLPFVYYVTWIVIRYTQCSALLIVLDKKFKYKKLGIYWLVRFLPKIFRSKAIVNKSNEGLLFVLFVVILMCLYVTFSQVSVSGFLLGLVGLWIIAIYYNNLNSALTYLLASICIIIAVLRIYVSPEVFIDNSSSVAYFLFLVGIIQDVVDYNS